MRARGQGPIRAAGCALAAGGVLVLAACAAPTPESRERRIAEATRGLEDDAAIRAQLEQVEAALARERGEVLLDDFEVRIGDRNDGENTLRLLTRVPVPNPFEIGPQREARRAETEASVAQLEEAVLEYSTGDCLRGLEGAAYRGHVDLYQRYVERQQGLLSWNEDWRRSGRLNERSATTFEIERRVRLARRLPEAEPPGLERTAGLPPLGRPAAALDRDPDRVRELVRRHHPGVGGRAARSERYEALSRRAEGRGLPWFEFVDFGYEVKQSRPDEIGGQVAVRVPLGFSSRADASRYRALGRAELLEGQHLVEENVRLGQMALAELDHFEENSERWHQLLDLAQRADQVAERWEQQRLAKPSDVATLYDRAYEARRSVLEARTRAGFAGCQLLSLTGVAPADWPRG